MDNWLALYIAVVWYSEITVEQAIKQLEGRKMLAPYRVGELDEDTVTQIYKIVSSRKFSNVDKLEKQYRMHRCEICRAILQRYGGEAMGICGDSCRGKGRPRTRNYSNLIKEEKAEIREKKAKQNTNTAKSIMQKLKTEIREKKAKQNTNTAKSIMQKLKTGDSVMLTYEKRTAKVMVISKNDRILTVKDEQGRIDTIHIADIVTKEAKIQGMGA